MRDPGFEITEWQQLFIEFIAYKRGIPIDQARQEYIDGWNSIPGGYRGPEFKRLIAQTADLASPLLGKTPEEVAKSYERFAELHLLRWTAYKLQLWPAQQEFLMEKRKHCSAFYIVDYGCGDAQKSLSLAKELISWDAYVNITFIDVPTLRKDFVLWATDQIGADSCWVDSSSKGPGERYGDVIEAADVIIAWEVLEHVFNPEHTMSMILRSLGTHGHLVANINDHGREYFHVSTDLSKVRALMDRSGMGLVGPPNLHIWGRK